MKQGLATTTVSAAPVAAPDDADWLDQAKRTWAYVSAAVAKGWAALPVSRFLPGSDLSSSIDIDSIADRLAVETRAREDGRNERPPTGDDALSGMQAEIIHYFRRMQAKAQDQLARLNQQAAKTADKIDVDDATARLADVPSRCHNEALRIRAEFQPLTVRLAERENQQRQYYRAFREQHKLERIASDTFSPFTNIAIVATLIIVTTFILSRFAVPGTEGLRSLSPGWALAIGVAAVIIPYAIGASVLRYVNHNDATLRSLAWLTAIAAVVGIAGVVYASTYTLEFMAANPESAPGSIMAAMLNDPWSLVAHLGAWQQTSVLGGLSLIALFAGYRCDDPYPGYGQVQRDFYRARHQRERLMAKLRHRINAMVDSADNEVVGIAGRLRAALRRLGTIVEKAERVGARLPDYNSALEDGCNIVLDRYRHANLEARSTGRPQCFSEYVCFRTGDQTDGPAAGDGRHRFEAITARMAEFDKHVVSVRQKLRDLNSRSIHGFEDAEAADDAE